MKPRLLDLFCGAGGAAMGYARAGFDVVGVDIRPQPNYPFDFLEADALTLNHGFMRKFDVIHASPPCQRYSAMSDCRPGLAEKYPDLVDATRDLLKTIHVPWVIENVERSPLRDPITLCGSMYGLPLYRHRLFESSLPLTAPAHQKHVIPTSRAGHWKPGTIISVAGHVAPMAEARRAMGINWMNRDELVEAIPPAYTEHLGNQLMPQLTWVAA